MLVAGGACGSSKRRMAVVVHPAAPWTRPGSTTGGSLLADRCPLPLDEPFTAAQARASGVSRAGPSTRWCATGSCDECSTRCTSPRRHPTTLDLRARRALALVVPDEAVVADRTAAWLHGVDILPRRLSAYASAAQRRAHERHPDASSRRRDGHRRGLIAHRHHGRAGRAASPRRCARRSTSDASCGDSTPSRRSTASCGSACLTTCSSPRSARFKGYRGVRQLRALAPLGDGRAESPGESALRLHWHDAGLPWPELQIWIYDDDGTPLFRLDITLTRMLVYAAEYDGEEFHTERRGPGARPRRAVPGASRTGSGRSTRSPRTTSIARRLIPSASCMSGHREARRSTALWTPRRTER